MNKVGIKEAQRKITEVAVAVIAFENQYLLGYRHVQQHQGNKYEFVGGKLEANETAEQALIREVNEEIALQIAPSQHKKMGEINHDYPEKTVRLHIFVVQTTAEQYEFLQNKATGELGQPLVWVEKKKLVAGEYPLPEANLEILSWL